jgi:hypothetical protein
MAQLALLCKTLALPRNQPKTFSSIHSLFVIYSSDFGTVGAREALASQHKSRPFLDRRLFRAWLLCYVLATSPSVMD